MRNVFRFVVVPLAVLAVIANLKDIRRYLRIRSM